MHVFHIATAADWAAAQESGSYTTSTRGRTLAEEGFIHASRREQVADVFARYYRGSREPLVLLTVDTDRLDVPWREEPVQDDTFPHIYGALGIRAVVDVAPLNRRGGTESFASILAKEMFVRITLALVAMLLAVVGSQLGGLLRTEWGGFLGGLAGLAVGAVVFVTVLRRRG